MASSVLLRVLYKNSTNFTQFLTETPYRGEEARFRVELLIWCLLRKYTNIESLVQRPITGSISANIV